ncbi:hypothetical protein D3C73_1459330 [compost metagenome]
MWYVFRWDMFKFNGRSTSSSRPGPKLRFTMLNFSRLLSLIWSSDCAPSIWNSSLTCKSNSSNRCCNLIRSNALFSDPICSPRVVISSRMSC